jgi:hypothetical protein
MLLVMLRVRIKSIFLSVLYVLLRAGKLVQVPEGTAWPEQAGLSADHHRQRREEPAGGIHGHGG